MALTLLVASGLALAAGVESAAKSSVVGPGESIQKAVNAADPGDTIVVKGVHREDVVIRKNGIKLRGDDAVIEAPTRAKADSLCSRFVGGPEAICVLGDENINTDKLEGPRVSDVSVSGFTIRGFDIEADAASVIDVYGARNTTVVGNRTTGNVAGGIVIGRSINTTIANNDFLGNPMGNPARDAEGIDINPDSRNTKIVNNVVRRYEQGIIADEAVGTTIVGNDSIGNALAGIGVGDSPGTKILSNTTRRNGFVGLYFAGGSPGANAEPVNAKIAGNDLSGANFGVFVANAQGGSFAANEVHNNCAGVVFFSDFGPPSGNFEVKGNQVENNTRKCPAEQGGEAYSGIGIGLFGARGMEVTGNHLSGNVPSGPSAVSGGVVVGVDPLFGGTTKPMNNSVTGNHFGRNKPDIFWDKSGSGNRFVGNLCDTSVPSRLCN
jgi:parallel beta-helix repeat protein